MTPDLRAARGGDYIALRRTIPEGVGGVFLLPGARPVVPPYDERPYTDYPTALGFERVYE